MSDITPKITHEYSYHPNRLGMIAAIIFFGGCTAVLVNTARTNYRGLIINRMIELVPETATNLYWALALFSLGLTLTAVYVTLLGICFRRRIALTASAIIMPKSYWSSKEVTIEFSSITSLAVPKVKTARGKPLLFLILTTSETKQTIYGSWLPSKEDFVELVDSLVPVTGNNISAKS